MLQYSYNSVAEILAIAEREQIPFWSVAERAEAEKTGYSILDIRRMLSDRLQIFRESVMHGREDLAKTPSGMSGGQAQQLLAQQAQLLGPLSYDAMANAVAVSEANAKMYRIVACPTAGSCGIVPGTFVALESHRKLDNEIMINGLLSAAAIGNVITTNATVAGAEGGCQAECGAAVAMAAAGIVTMLAGTNEQVVQGAALAMKNVLGLVCDPVAGLVEVPCVKRNGLHAVHALASAEMALQGLVSAIPCDEVIQAMWEIGKAMPAAYRETSEGGLARTQTGKRIAEMVAEL